MAADKFTVGAVGAGAIETVVCACLAEAGVEVVAADLPERIAEIKKHGLRLHWGDRRISHAIGSVDSISALADVKPDCILVATKSYILPDIMAEVAAAAGEDCLVVSVANGIDTEVEMTHYLTADNVARMVINFAAGSDEGGFTRVVWFNPPNAFGLLADKENPNLERLVKALNTAGLTSEQVSGHTIKEKAFLKTILNSALMPLCSVMGITMKEAMTGTATRKLAGDVIHEGLAVAERLGYTYAPGVWETCMSYLDNGGNHHPSMSADTMNKRPTAIGFITGKLLEVGRQFSDLNLEVNRVLVSMLMTQEVRNGTRQPTDFPDYILPTEPASSEG